MPIFHSPLIVTNSLVFYYDMNNSKKSWLGKPITNQFAVPTPAANGDVTFSVQGTGIFKRIFQGIYGGYEIQPTDVVYRYDLGGTGCHYHGNDVAISSGQYATFTFDYYISQNAANYPTDGYLANMENVGGGAVSVGTGVPNSTRGIWQTVTIGGQASANGTQRMLLYPGGCSGSLLASSGYILFKNPQVIFGSTSNETRPFVAGTRSSTQALRDLAGNNAITINSLTYNSDGTFSFNGAGDSLNLPSSIGYTTTVSAFAWVKTTGSPRGGYHIIFGGQELEISIPTSGEIRTGVYTNSRFVSNHGSGLTDGNWHYIGFTFDGTTKTSYIDGQNVGTQAVTGTLTSSVSGRSMGIFGQGDTSYGMNGYIASTHVYNRSLSATEIRQNFNTQRGRFGI